MLQKKYTFSKCASYYSISHSRYAYKQDLGNIKHFCKWIIMCLVDFIFGN